MNFIEAFKLLQDGKEIKRSYWPDSLKLVYGLIHRVSENSFPSSIDVEHLFAEDWEEVVQPFVSSENAKYLFHWLQSKENPKRIELFHLSAEGWYNSIWKSKITHETTRIHWNYFAPVIPPTVE